MQIGDIVPVTEQHLIARIGQRQREHSGLSFRQIARDLRDRRPARRRIDQDMDRAAARQAKINLVGAAAIQPHDGFIDLGDLGDQLRFQATVGERADHGAVAANRELRSQLARKAALDSDDRAQGAVAVGRRVQRRVVGEVSRDEWRVDRVSFAGMDIRTHRFHRPAYYSQPINSAGSGRAAVICRCCRY